MRLYPTAVNKYFAHPTCAVRAESSKRSLRNTVRLFQSDHPDLELHQLTQEHLLEWLGNKRQNGLSDSTAKKYVQRLRSLLGWCSWHGDITSNPAENLEKVLMLRPQPVRTHRWLSEEQVRRVLDSVESSEPLTVQDHRDALVLRLGFTIGLRSFEIRTLPLAALANLDKEQITVNGKGGKLADVFAPERTAVLLDSWLDRYEDPKPDDPVVIGFRSVQDWESGNRLLVPQWGRGITQQAIGRIVAERTAEVGLQVSPHDMRRSYAGIMEQKVGVVETSRALRHAQISTTQLYLEQRQDSAYQAARKAGLNL